MAAEEALLVALGYRVLAPVVCGTDKQLPGLLLERAKKLYADRQQGGDATTPTGVLYIKCTGDCCAGRPLELHATGGCIFSGNAFEAHAGRSYRKKWRETIRVMPQNISLKGWLSSVGRECGRDSPPERGPDATHNHDDVLKAAATAVASVAAAAAASPRLPLPAADTTFDATCWPTHAAAVSPKLPALAQIGAARDGIPSPPPLAPPAHPPAVAQATLLQLALEQQRQQQAAKMPGNGGLVGLGGSAFVVPGSSSAAGAMGLEQQLLQQLQPRTQQHQHQQRQDPLAALAAALMLGRPSPLQQPASPSEQQQQQQRQQFAASPLQAAPGERPQSAVGGSEDELAATVVGVICQLQSQQEQLVALASQLAVAQQLIAAQAEQLAAGRAAQQQQAAVQQQLREEMRGVRAAIDILISVHLAEAPKRKGALESEALADATSDGVDPGAAGASVAAAGIERGEPPQLDGLLAIVPAEPLPQQPAEPPQQQAQDPGARTRDAAGVPPAGHGAAPPPAAAEPSSPGTSPSRKRLREEGAS